MKTTVILKFITRKPDIGQQGSIIFCALAVIFIVVTAGLPVLVRGTNENKISESSVKSAISTSIAEAGVERAMWELNYGNISSWSGDTSLRTIQINDFTSASGEKLGNINISVLHTSSPNPEIDAIATVAAGMLQEKRKKLAVQLARGNSGPWQYAILGWTIGLGNNGSVDAYDSRLGEYNVAGNRSLDAPVVTISDSGRINSTGSNFIYGDILCNPNRQPIGLYDPAITLSGTQKQLSQPITWPGCTCPAGLPYRGYQNQRAVNITINQNGEYTTLSTNSSTITISGDVTLLITAGFYLGSRGDSLKLLPGSRLKLYLGPDAVMDCAGNTYINNQTKDPSALQILKCCPPASCTNGLCTDPGIRIQPGPSAVYAAIYAPGRRITISSSCEFYGAIAGCWVDLNSSTNIHYDKALATVVPGGNSSSSVTYTVKSWQEVAP